MEAVGVKNIRELLEHRQLMEESRSKTATRHSGQRKRPAAPPQLSCELCRERKVKCDKLEPCTNCISSGVICVPIHRLRLPRGVHARSRRASPPSPTVHVKAHSTNAELNENSLSKCIQRLESLVDSLGSTTTRAECISSGYNQRQVSWR